MIKLKMHLTVILVFLMLVQLPTLAFAYQIVGLDNFKKSRQYSCELFGDVDSSAWYYENVAAVYEYGMMQGKGNGVFDPLGDLTIAEAITVAVNINSTYFYGGLPFWEDNNEYEFWYTPYVDEALFKGIIEEGGYDYTAPATRAQFAEILVHSIDPIDLCPINIVDSGSIPDVPMTADYAEAVYRLYRAGILTGSDSNGSFHPDSSITRAEAAAIITRIIDSGLRKSIELVGEY